MTKLQTQIWAEEPQEGNPFAAGKASLYGYDVYGDMLGKVSWADMIFLLFTGQAPSAAKRDLLNDLAVALANPGPREPSVHAAMSSGVSGSPAAATLMAALSVSAGQGGGGRDVFMAMTNFVDCGVDDNKWRERLTNPPTEKEDTWPVMEHAPGFEPHSEVTSLIVQQTLHALASHVEDGALKWLEDNQDDLQDITGRALSFAGVAAAAYIDLGLSPVQGEMLHLMLRLPGAAVHALEQSDLGFKNFPFPNINLLDDPENPDAAPTPRGEKA